jgi:predicted transcriptional regulator of viral defense system
MKIETLRKLAGREEIDYGFILSALKGYAKPRNKISTWLKTKELVRVKKGLYVFGETIALQPYSKEVLANLIYGPSALSLMFALSYYGLIPERVTVMTSVTNNRVKAFSTDVGVFRYYYLNSEKYSIGVILNQTTDQHDFLIASPEKALADQIHIADKSVQLNNINDIEKYLLDDIRIDERELLKFKLSHLDEIINHYHDERIALLKKYIRMRK